MVPEAVGGTDTLTNLVSLCDDCHSKVHGAKAVDQSALTKAGLAAAKERGVQLGGPRRYLDTENTRRAGEALRNAQAVASLVVPLRERGATLQEVADALNGGGVLTPRGREWRPVQVSRVLGRLSSSALG